MNLRKIKPNSLLYQPNAYSGQFFSGNRDLGNGTQDFDSDLLNNSQYQSQQFKSSFDNKIRIRRSNHVQKKKLRKQKFLRDCEFLEVVNGLFELLLDVNHKSKKNNKTVQRKYNRNFKCESSSLKKKVKSDEDENLAIQNSGQLDFRGSSRIYNSDSLLKQNDKEKRLLKENFENSQHREDFFKFKKSFDNTPGHLQTLGESLRKDPNQRICSADYTKEQCSNKPNDLNKQLLEENIIKSKANEIPCKRDFIKSFSNLDTTKLFLNTLNMIPNFTDQKKVQMLAEILNNSNLKFSQQSFTQMLLQYLGNQNSNKIVLNSLNFQKELPNILGLSSTNPNNFLQFLSNKQNQDILTSVSNQTNTQKNIPEVQDFKNQKVKQNQQIIPQMDTYIPQMSRKSNQNQLKRNSAQQNSITIQNQKKTFKKSATHVAIAYFIYIKQFEEQNVSHLENIQMDPTFNARRLRENKSNNKQFI